MKLFSSPTSPYARKVRIMIIELGLQDSIEIVAAAPMENPPALQEANPVGKVPTLVLENGMVLHDSPVICEYIDVENGSKFLPVGGDARWDCLTRHALADGVIDASFMRTAERNRPPEQQSPMWLERWENAITRSLAEFEKNIITDRFDLGDIATTCALGYLDLRHGDMNWRAGNDDLAAWFEKISARESVRQTVPG